jgi:WD40 repeat protein/predicted Ser/Thr protein kinase
MTPLREFEHYTLLGQIAEGGMGVVYQAVHRGLNRSCALKLIRTGLLATPDERRRFVTEAEAAARLDHPNIVRVGRAAEFEGQWFLEMELVEGGTLADRLGEGPVPAQDTARLVERLARAVQHAHERGVLHRDLKPANVLLSADGHPKLTDFGLARFLEKDSDLTRTIAVLGTPAYLAPELASGRAREATTAADIYSLGVILFECLTGQRPFQGQSPLEILRAVQDTTTPRPSSLRPDVSLDLETICLKCLEKEPAKRYATAQELADELNRFLHDEPIHARPVGRVEKAWRWCRRKPALAVSLLLILLLLLLITIGSPLAAYRINRERQRAEEQTTRAELQSRRAEDNAANERRERYYASIAAADSHIRNGDIDVALSVLTNCPPELRHWEWGRLLYLCHQSVSTTRLPTNNLDALIVNADGTRAVAAPMVFRTAGRVVCWDVPTSQEVFEVAGESNSVGTMTFSPDGERLAVALLNGAIRVWDAESGRERFALVSSNQVTGLQFDAAGTRLAVSFLEGHGQILDAATGQTLHTTPIPAPGLRAAAIDPTGRYWATMDQESFVTVRDARSGETRFGFHGNELMNPVSYRKTPLLAFSPDGRRLLAHASAESAKVWNLETGREILFIPSKVFNVAFSPDGTRVAVSAGAKTAEVWNLATTTKAQTTYSHRQRINFVGFDRTGRRLRTGSTDGTLKTWPAHPGREWIPHPFHVDFVAFRPDGQRFLTTQFDGVARVWETATGRELLNFRGNWSWLRTASFSPDGQRIVTGGADRFARIFDAETGRELAVMKGHTSAVRSAVFSPDGRKIATGSWDKTARLWDAATGRELFTLRAHSLPVKEVAFSPDGARLYSAGHDPAAQVWDVETGRHLFELRGGSSWLYALALSPDGRRVVTGSQSGSLRLWDAESGELLAKWSSARASIVSLDFSPDGKRLLVVASDLTGVFIQPSMEIWDVETGRQILSLSGHPSMILMAKFSPDGQRILNGYYAASGNEAGAARLWETFPWDERFYPDAREAGFSGVRPSPGAGTSDSPAASEPAKVLVTARISAPEDGRTPAHVSPSRVFTSTPLLPRIRTYAANYWRERLAAEDQAIALGPASPPIEPLRFPKSAWLARDTNADRHLLDLSPHYNALLNVPWEIILHERGYDDDFSNLPTGIVNLAGIDFDVRGVIHLAITTNHYWRGANYVSSPTAVTGIAVAASVRRFHVLHGVGSSMPELTLVARFILHYADGSRHEIPVLYGQDVREVWELDADAKPNSDRGIVAWRGTNPAVAQRNGKLRLFRTAFDNPRPEQEIQSIDLVSALPSYGYLVLAITVEP